MSSQKSELMLIHVLYIRKGGKRGSWEREKSKEDLTPNEVPRCTGQGRK